MTDKKLFPGTTHEEIEKQKLLAEQERKAKELKEQQQKEAWERAELHSKYVRQDYSLIHELEHGNPMRDFFRLGLVANGVYLVFGLLEWVGTELHMPPYHVIRNAWNPISDGKFIEPNDDGSEGGYVEYDKKRDGKFSPAPIWYINMAALLIAIYAMIGEYASRKKRRKEHDNNLKIDTETVDMMYDLKKLGKQYNLNTAQVEKLVKLAPAVISHMSKDESVYFNMLINGDIEIANNKTFYEMAHAIMRGHLQKHPEDIKTIMDVFAMESIPKDLLQKYNSHNR